MLLTNKLPSKSTAALLAGMVASSAAIAGLPTAAAAATTQQATTPPATTHTVTLITGDQVQVTMGKNTGKNMGKNGQPRYTVQAVAQSYRNADGDEFVVPAAAQPFVNRQLDPSLFDVSALVRAGVDGSAKLPVTLTFAAGARQVAPAGITITATAGNTATGHLTDTAAFAAALRAAIGADIAAHRPAGSTAPFAGLDSIRLAGAPTGAIQPRFPMHLLQINGIDSTGAPGNLGVLLINTDSFHRFTTSASVFNGSGRIELPAGHYSLESFAPDFDANGRPTAARTLMVNDFTVADSPNPSTVSFDMRTANSPVSVSAPADKPASTLAMTIAEYRFDALGGVYPIYTDSDGSLPDYVNPTPAAQVGRLHYVVSWFGGSPATSADPYAYNVAFGSDNGIAADQHYQIKPNQLATLHNHLYAQPGTTDPSYLESWYTDSEIWSQLAVPESNGMPVPATGDVTTYLGAGNGGRWLVGVDTPTGFLTNEASVYQAGRDYSADWWRGPLAAGVGQYTGFQPCQACSAGGTITVNVPDLHDSAPDHLASFMNRGYPTLTDHFTLYRDGTQVFDGDNTFGTVLSNAPTTPSSYRAVLDTTVPAGTPASQSTATHTEVTFRYAPDAAPGSALPGTALPAGDTCAGQAANTPCQILPMLSLNYQLAATDRFNTSTAPVQAMALRVGHLSYDGAGSRAPITSATVSVSGDGGKTWQPATVLGLAGQYVALWPNSGAVGSTPWLRVTATDAAGGSITQTIDNAYTIGKSTIGKSTN